VELRPQETRTPARHTSGWVALALVGALVLVWVLGFVTPWVDRTSAFITFFAVVALLILLVDSLIVLVGPGLWRFARSLGVSIGRAVRDDEEVRALVARHPRFFSWITRRFSAETPSGLYLTVTVAASVYFLMNFLSIALSLALSTAITRYDPAVEALLRAFRTPGLTRMFWVATLLADARVIAFLTVAAVLLLAMWGKQSQAGLLALTMLGGGLVQTIVQLLARRVRPSAEFAVIRQPGSFSFPAGASFATMLLLSALLFVLWRTLPSLAVQLAVVWATLLVVLFVGVSQVYLGVNWMSDVIASWSLALSWLTITCGYYLVRVRYRGTREGRPALWNGTVRLAITAAMCAASLGAVVVGAQVDPLLAKAAAGPATRPWTVTTDSAGLPTPTAADMRQLPLFSEKLDGSRQEPISIVFVGTQAQLISAFQAAGWQLADNPSPVTLFRASVAAIANHPYPNAPVTPTFLDGAVQDVAFEKSAGIATVRTRHHVRFWRTHETLGGEPVWVATASFDSRLEIGSAIPLPTHHIEPDIDAEQAYIVQDMVRTGRVALVARVRVTQPLSGTNAQGDQWFTQGYASVLRSTP